MQDGPTRYNTGRGVEADSDHSADALFSAKACELGPFDDAVEELEGRCEICPACGGKVLLQSERAKASWREIIKSPSRPSWYTIPGSCESLPMRAVKV
jgi:hypothetical protein